MSDEAAEHADMTNKMARRRYNNMRAFMVYRELTPDALARITSLGLSTIANCFSAKRYKRAASDRTMATIYKMFPELPAECLDKADFDPSELSRNVPATVAEKVFVQIGRATFSVTQEEAKRLLYMVALDG